MKTTKYQRRFYRDWVRQKDLHLAHIMDKETDLQILTNKPIDKDFLKERIRQYRWDIENYIIKERRFLTSLKPIEVELNAPEIVKEMTQAAKLANVGPMASIAGAIAEFLGKDLLEKGYKDVLIENGGDIFLATRKTRIIGIYAGKSKLWQNLSLKIKPKDTPLGICASSGTIGHSLSFGCADSVVILSKSASLADAVATATANRINSKEDLSSALDFSRSIKGICGAAIIFRNNLASWGKVEFVKFKNA
ncbi:MAG: UPF0280 family protein [Candidatus Omnitrophota bacterium]|nr:UPF0280 family protein [Candidatus Omnitrophota bacterium]